MNNHKSQMSLTFRQPRDRQDIQAKNTVARLDEIVFKLAEDVAHVRKQMKSKVSRSEFLSSLSSKLSISELASINSLKIVNENKNPNMPFETWAKLQRQQAHIKDQLKSKISEIQSREESVQDLISLQGLQLTKIKQSLDQLQDKNNASKQKLCQFEAYVYSKADRSQLQKLFSLNELLVIEIQQCKKLLAEQQKSISNTKYDIFGEIKLMASSNKETKAETKKIEKQIQQTKYLLQTFKKHINHEVGRVISILEEKQYFSEEKKSIFNITLDQLNQHIKLMEEFMKEGSSSSLKEMNTRLNILELKENQINRAVKDVDSIKIQFETFKLELMELNSARNQVGVPTRLFCQQFVMQSNQQIQRALCKQIEVMCEEVMKKVVELTSQFLSKDQVNSLLSPLKEKLKHLSKEIQQEKMKIQFLDKKQQQQMQKIDEESERIEQRFSQITNLLHNYMTIKKYHELSASNIQIDDLQHISKQIELRMNMEIKKVVEDQNKINQVICAQNIIAKWFWTSSSLKNGNLVPWDRQVVNTLPENFKWNKGQPQIHIHKGGYYRIQLGFYSKRKPAIQVIVNGQTIVSAVNSNSYVLHHSSGKLKDVSQSEVSGLTLIDFLLLPDEARIAISYSAQYSGEGFIYIQRI